MDEAERITVSLPLPDELKEAISTGEYPSPDAAVADAVEAWTAERLIARIGVEKIRKHWERGIASGNPQPLDLENALRRAFARAEGMRADRSRVG